MACLESHIREVLDETLVLSWSERKKMNDTQRGKHLAVLLFTTPYSSESTSTTIKLVRSTVRRVAR